VLGEPRAVVTDELIDFWTASHRAFDSFRVAMLPTDKSEITGIATETVGEWWVIRVGSDVAEQFLERGSNPEAGALNSGVGKDNG